MKFGHFEDEKREYVIDTPRTPLPWINYLGNEDFFALCSNTAGGYAFYKDARLRRLTRYRYNASPLDADGFHIYIKDGETVWNPGWQPMQTELDTYQCRHGLGYTVIRGEKDGICVTQEMLVPRRENCLLIRVTAENRGDTKRAFSMFPYVEFCLWDANDDATNFQRNYSTGEVEVLERAILHKTEYRERRDHFAALFSDRKPDGFDTAREKFIGVYGGPAKPQAVLDGKCTGSVAHGWQPVGAMQFDMELGKGSKDSVLICLAYIENGEDKWEAPGVVNKKKLNSLMNRYSSPKVFDGCMDELRRLWDGLLSGYVVSSENKTMDRMVNIWNQYQCMVTFNMSRSASYFESGMGRGMGFRDSCQDLLGFVHMIPERARERILDIAATQFPDGSAYHQYQPLTKRGNMAVGSGFNDDPLWLIACTDAYLRESGDWSILSERVPFDNDETSAQPLLEHLRRSFNYTVEHLGPHGLPLIGRADWNDCLNLNCFSSRPGESFQTTGPNSGPVAESVFIAGMFVKYGRAYSGILKHLGLEQECERGLTQIDQMEKTVLDSGWDGEWFRRAYDAFGMPVGSRECEEGQIFIEPQGMCVMAGIGKKTGEADKALRSVQARLDTKYGILLNQPAYTSYHLELGEISSYPPGYKENASVFCHNNAWVVCAEAEMGHGRRAFELYCKTAPAFLEDISDIHRTEPYAYCQTIAGRDSCSFGEAKNSWLTGTAAWTFVSISQSILGVIPELEGLRIAPSIPAEWNEYTVHRIFRGAEYDITVKNPDHVESGVLEIRVNGEIISGTVLPLMKCGEKTKVEVLMKKEL